MFDSLLMNVKFSSLHNYHYIILTFKVKFTSSNVKKKNCQVTKKTTIE